MRPLGAHSSSGLGHRPLKAEITGSNPVCATNPPFLDTKTHYHPHGSPFHSLYRVERIMAPDLKRMERDILEAAHKYGSIGRLYYADVSAAQLTTPASRAIAKKYLPSRKAYRSTQETYANLVAVIDYLVEKRYLLPYFDKERKERSGEAAGLTPEGLRRLQELRCRVRTWVINNWFPAIVAVVTITIGVSSIVVDATCNRA